MIASGNGIEALDEFTEAGASGFRRDFALQTNIDFVDAPGLLVRGSVAGFDQSFRRGGGGRGGGQLLRDGVRLRRFEGRQLILLAAGESRADGAEK